MAVFKRRCLFYLVEVTYSKSLVILLLVSITIETFMEGDKMCCIMTVHNVSYDDDASEYVMQVTYILYNPIREEKKNATYRLDVTGVPEFCGTKLPNEINLINKNAEVEICGHPKPEVNFYIHESKRLPGACELTEGRLKKYKCKVELTDLKCGEKLNLKIRGYQNMKLSSSSILIANYTPIDLKFEKKSIDCYNLSWSVHPLAKPCVKEYQLVVNQIDKAPLNTTTKTSNYLICSKSIQSCKVRTLCKSNQESDWVTAAITVGIPQSKDNASFYLIFISAALAIFAIILLIIGLVLLKKKLYKRSFKKPSSLEGLTRRHEEEGPKAYPNHYEETMFFAKHPQPV
ncbi:uncharacterized protein LOC130635947 isoform X2 [Hydractinia symbiolongicarpus]|uniref:uncharacterized protein LOC130635947 isoform X2 n=1 Tax=Hydractinia symbiolongicarpus TaxID=13093 RepID=UPI00254D1B70|nr:uncharacterized protein LOC130635947 isoform X2 [Hydractinia symbiolongicarpus]XP_057301470.1 uncharacterized protein LOC130635947 isoform X2 [Hydractinia symbiolongicarpus]XP_057301471.1 uncharacterized protein LOC130635947 isoform X2 [Hydractinia symbiolongicarpus]XP_057301472.1 uncharacterized protein LOC130635947 isoform X2 [Hydractinia symbiolongicarpus]